MANTKKSILIYFDNFPMVVALPPEQRGWILTVLMTYGEQLCLDETVTLEKVMKQFPLSSEAKLVCGFMGANIRRDNQRWLSRQQSRQQCKGQSSAAPAGRRSILPPIPDAEKEARAREDMERARRLLEQFQKEA